jgi:hypothetical protein
MKLIKPLFFVLALALSIQLFAQDTLIFKSNLGAGLITNREGKSLNFRYLIKSSADIPEAKRYFKKARLNNVVSTIFAFPGGFMVGYPLGLSLSGQKLNTDLLMIGGGLILVSVPFNVWRNKNMRKGVDSYNRGVYRGE